MANGKRRVYTREMDLVAAATAQQARYDWPQPGDVWTADPWEAKSSVPVTFVVLFVAAGIVVYAATGKGGLGTVNGPMAAFTGDFRIVLGRHNCTLTQWES